LEKRNTIAPVPLQPRLLASFGHGPASCVQLERLIVQMPDPLTHCGIGIDLFRHNETEP
jgi:hypothetical protein